MPHLPGTERLHSVTAALALQQEALCLSSIIVLAHIIVSGRRRPHSYGADSRDTTF